jgi:flagellar hook-length control protein FliK
MIEMSFAASPPAQIQPAATVSPHKTESKDSSGLDFDKVLKAQEKQQSEVDGARNRPSAARQHDRPSETGRQDGGDKVKATGNQTPRKEIHAQKANSKHDETQETGNGVDQTTSKDEPEDEQKQAAVADATLQQQTLTQAVPLIQMVVQTTEVVDAVPTEAQPQAAVQTVQAQPAQPAAVPVQMGPAAVNVDTGAKMDANAGTAGQNDAAQAQSTPVDENTLATDGQGAQTNTIPFAQALKSFQASDQKSAAQAVDQSPAQPQDGQQNVTAVGPAQAAPTAQALAGTVKAETGEALKSVQTESKEAQHAAVSPASASSSSSQMGAVQVQSAPVKSTAEVAPARDTSATASARPLEMLQQVAKSVEASLQQGRNSLRLQLNPQDLGAIDIRLVSSGHKVSMTVIAEQASTGRLLETQFTQLRQTLAEAGVQLSQLNVGQQNQPGQFGQRFTQQQTQSDASSRQAQSPVSSEAEAASARSVRANGLGVVDYRV